MNQFILKRPLCSNFTQISNEFLHDNNVSILARGIGVFLLSKPNNWVINQENICQELEIGRDKLKKIFTELIDHGYMYKCRYITFAKKNEQSVFFYISDSKEHLYNEVISRDVKNKISTTQMSISPITKSPLLKNSNTENSYSNIINFNKDYLSFKNKENTKKENNNIIDPLLLDFLSIHLDEITKNNVLKITPKITLEKFKTLFEKCKIEYNLGFSKNFNSTLILALKGEWRFQDDLKIDKKLKKDRRILMSKVEYFKDLYLETREPQESILNKFIENCKSTYSQDLIDEYSELLKNEIA